MAGRHLLLIPVRQQQHAATQTDNPSCCSSVQRQLEAVQRELAVTQARLRKVLASSALTEDQAANTQYTDQQTFVQVLASSGSSHRSSIEALLLCKNAPQPSPAPREGAEQDPLQLSAGQDMDSETEDWQPEVSDRSEDSTGAAEDKAWPMAKRRKQRKPDAKPCPPRRSRAKVRPFPCPCCDQAFFSENALIKHKVCHQEGKPFACSLCQRRYRLPNSLRHHEAAAHGLGPALHCEHCDKAFGTRSELRSHLVIHTGERPHTCSQCDKRFSHRAGLLAHERSHHDAPRRHLCDMCGRYFSSAQYLRAHKNIHTGERPFVCDVCGRCFRHRLGLQTHHATHSDERPFRCKVCDRTFKSRPVLYGHSKTHATERPFVCSVCCKAFARKASLAQHRLLHSGERPHQCTDCGRGFIRSSRLAEHQRTAHGTKPAAPAETCEQQTGLE